MLAGVVDRLGAVGVAQPAGDGGIPLRSLPQATAVIAPQSEWPQTTMSATPSAVTAYSTEADTPPGSWP
ncbi:Uncharacterised protein [Chromobacterium violaceum]|uniref:Uncharacterized protein n=1 Tax=Chromobacterium violaceum TaxID=536 RepID=A0A3S5DLF4_CHRVL|nr:Uncharacterised protein [Chromobacterium violaceum]